MQTSNPAFRDTAFRRARTALGTTGRTMTVEGAAAKSLLLLALVLAAGGWTWVQGTRLGIASIGWAVTVGALAGCGVALLTIFVPRLAPVTAPIYAVLEGVAIGGISLMVNTQYHGLPMLAVALTMGLAAAAFALYAFRIVRVTKGFARAVLVGMVGLLCFYLLHFVLGLFGVALPSVLTTGWIGIGICALAVGLATACLLLDFAHIETMATSGAPARAEWYAAFGLLVTLVWLYMEVLRLLQLLTGDD